MDWPFSNSPSLVGTDGPRLPDRARWSWPRSLPYPVVRITAPNQNIRIIAPKPPCAGPANLIGTDPLSNFRWGTTRLVWDEGNGNFKIMLFFLKEREPPLCWGASIPHFYSLNLDKHPLVQAQMSPIEGGHIFSTWTKVYSGVDQYGKLRILKGIF